MIACVAGTLAVKKPTHVVIDVGGLGYRLLIPTSTYERLGATGESARLLAHHHVREQAVTLFGFATEGERAVFETMLGVSGVGPKLALAALSAMSPRELRNCVVEEDTSLLARIPGVGRKTADRLIVELRDRMADLEALEGGDGGKGSDARVAAREDARAALQELGFSKAGAEKALRKVLRDNSGIQSADQLVRLALRER